MTSSIYNYWNLWTVLFYVHVCMVFFLLAWELNCTNTTSITHIIQYIIINSIESIGRNKFQWDEKRKDPIKMLTNMLGFFLGVSKFKSLPCSHQNCVNISLMLLSLLFYQHLFPTEIYPDLLNKVAEHEIHSWCYSRTVILYGR